MTEISLLTLWIIVVVQSVLLLGLAREVGLIQLRVGSSSAMETADEGLPAGSLAPSLEVSSPDGEVVRVGAGAARPHLIAFASPSCGVCHNLVGPLGILAGAERDLLDVVVICTSTSGECGDFLRPIADRVRIGVDKDGSVKKAFRVSGSSFALFVDRAGIVGQSGVVNTLQHLESLLRSVTRTGDVLLHPPEGEAESPAPIGANP